ncbi:MAG: ArsR family transcriptional regulator [Clostridia bacterium]|nr:ArsR family transcriptional regulator [Clostridia bacterium]
MRIIENLREGLPLFDALNSEIRIQIIQLLLKNHQMNMNDLALTLNIPKSTLTPHIKKLVQAELISVSLSSQARGAQKICQIAEDKLIVNIQPQATKQKIYESEIDVGQYTGCFVLPTCGLATSERVVGDAFDDSRFFYCPDRFQASVLWFAQGYIEYTVANMLSSKEKPEELQIFVELCSEAPGVLSYYPSDISFIVNGVNLGYWTSPGEFFDRKGRYTPQWWFPNFPQYGIMKVLIINETGTYLDGLFLSPTTIHNLQLDKSNSISLRLEVPETAKNVGGLTLFGKKFGDYEHGIRFRLLCSENETK